MAEKNNFNCSQFHKSAIWARHSWKVFSRSPLRLLMWLSSSGSSIRIEWSINRFKILSIKIPKCHRISFVELYKLILTFIRQRKGPRKRNHHNEEQNGTGTRTERQTHGTQWRAQIIYEESAEQSSGEKKSGF